MNVIRKTICGLLEPGDVFYTSPSPDLNPWYGVEVVSTGADMVFIAADTSKLIDDIVIVNGGFELQLSREQTCYVIGHYSDLLDMIVNDTEDL